MAYSNAKGSKEVTNKITAKGHDQYNDKHGTNININGKGKGNMADNEMKTSPKNDPKGWYDSQQGEPFLLTMLANMVALDRLKKLDKDNGTTDHVNHWKNRKGADKMASALQVKVDRDVSFMSATESHAQTNATNNTVLNKMWLIDAQVVAQENLYQWTYGDSQEACAG